MQVFTFGEDENEVVHCRGPQAVIPSPELRAHIMHSSIHTGSFAANYHPRTPFWTNQEE